MKEIAIYVEGGGNSTHQKGELRNGFDKLLDKQKQSARAKRLRWKTVFCGGRDAAFKAYLNAMSKASVQSLCVLLVDSEDMLPPEESVGDDESEG